MKYWFIFWSKWSFPKFSLECRKLKVVPNVCREELGYDGNMTSSRPKEHQVVCTCLKIALQVDSSIRLYSDFASWSFTQIASGFGAFLEPMCFFRQCHFNLQAGAAPKSSVVTEASHGGPSSQWDGGWFVGPGVDNYSYNQRFWWWLPSYTMH